MVAEAKIICHQSIPVLDVQYRCIVKGNNPQKIEDIVDVSTPYSPAFHQIRASDSVSTDIARSEDARSLDSIPDVKIDSAILQFVPTLRSGSFVDIGPRRSMEDEHIRIDDLPTHLGSLFQCPKHSAFYGVFDGHGGSDAATYVKKNAMKFFFKDAGFPQASEDDDVFLEEVEKSVRKAFLLADLALADDRTVSSSSGTTALTALILGRLLLVANAGDCRAVLCRGGVAIEMSQDHRPIHASERRRVEELGGYIDDGYLNGVLAVTRALGDWDMKFPRGSPSPLIAEPEFRQIILTEDDEFLIIGCDGIWDVMSSQHAVSIVRRGLRRHGDPEQCARDLVMEALRLNTFDNLTVIVVAFSSLDNHIQGESTPPRQQQKLRYCSLSAEALCSLKRLLDGNDSGN
ncbi:PREDICTED: probable protein phosphatase 2C 47 [Nelumbo nucifera]|uniref:protein-serine/threonine phosphatase n=1 Tax=Nelumbo nucifera TaxID=4432 RepID=A0A1U8B6E4_NELNU|nr:PREDICTED: probable protein phosphatase 2C 47 [Nelumbo nucifera]